MKTPDEMSLYLITEFTDKAEDVAKIGRDYSTAAGLPFWDSVIFGIKKHRLLKVESIAYSEEPLRY